MWRMATEFKFFGMFQAGIKNLTLIEKNGITFRYYDPLDLSKITNISNSGAQIVIENMQKPDIEIKYKFSKSGNMVHDYTVKFFILEYSIENLQLIEQIKSSIYGWCFLVEFYSGEFRYYDCPLVCREAAINPHKEMAFTVNMENAAPSAKRHLNYIPGISLIPVYRFDTELLTFDSEIYTWDYEL